MSYDGMQQRHRHDEEPNVNFEVFTAMKIQVVVFSIFRWVNMVFRNVDTLPQHYTASQPRRPRLE
jgi:hypothetical protein